MEKEEDYFEICEKLKKIIKKTGEPLEGNCLYKHDSFEKWGCLKNKRINYQNIAKNKDKICEIGFNAGHSFLCMILVNPNAEYTLFDLGKHKYSKPTFNFLKKIFPKTKISMIWGDSTKTIPNFYKKNPKKTFDVIHIDGGHQSKIYIEDWYNSLKLISTDGVLIFDDTDNNKISTFLDNEIKKGKVAETNEFLKTSGYEHRIFIKK